MSQLFGPQANQISRLLVMLLGLIMVSVPVGVYIYSRSQLPREVGNFPEQPIPFSHKHHVGSLGIDCGYCHSSVETSRFAGMPDTATCMSCHSQLWTQAELLAPLRESMATQRPIAWRRVHDMPDFVYFSHRAHVNNGVACQHCHGRVDRMPLTQQTEPMTMRWCLDCHRNPQPHLRPPGHITDMGGWEADAGQAALLRHYQIHPKGLSDCVVCHR